jgi:tetratricopeptide (TPR) repeat protein
LSGVPPQPGWISAANVGAIRGVYVVVTKAFTTEIDMRIRAVGVLLLAGVVCLGTVEATEGVSSLLIKGRQEFKKGNYEDAELYHRQAVSLAERGGDAAQFAEALADLGGVLLAKGRYEESKGFCVKALSLLRTAQTKRYLPVVLNHLSVLSNRDGADKETEGYLKEALRVAEALDPRDPYISHIQNNLGALYYKKRDIGRAEKAFRKAIAVIEKTPGIDRAELVPILANLAGLHVVRKEWDNAISLFDRALSLLQNSGNHPDAAAVLDSVGAMHYIRADFPEAGKAFRKAYAIRLEALGPQHPLVAGTAVKLAAALAAGGRYGEAEPLYRQALRVYETAGGPSAPQMVSTLLRLAELLRNTNKEEAAVNLEARAESIRFDLEHVVRIAKTP